MLPDPSPKTRGLRAQQSEKRRAMQEMPTASLRLRPLPPAAAASTLQKTTMDPPGLAAASSFDADASHDASSSHGSKSTALSPSRGRKASDASAPGSAGGAHGGGDRQAFLYSLYDILSMPHACSPVSGVP